MCKSDPADPVREPLEEVLPPVARCRQHVLVAAHLGDDVLHDGVEQSLAPRDVAVEGHRLDVQLVTEAAHGEVGKPVGLDGGQGGRHDEIATQRLTLGGRLAS